MAAQLVLPHQVVLSSIDSCKIGFDAVYWILLAEDNE
jgi:hypothetical protein